MSPLLLPRSVTNRDNGASAVVIAMSMLVIMGFAAIAIDYSLGVNERRLDQNSTDTAVLAAGVELIVSGDVQAAVDSAKQVVNLNLDRPVLDGEWTACIDPGALSMPSDTIPGITGGSNCISFGEADDGTAFARIRVKVPDQTTETVFAKLLGVIGLTTDAEAEAQLGGVFASGAFPAGVFNGAGPGDSFCIKTGTSGQASCGSPSTGDFGNFQPYFYSELNPGSPSTTCTSGNQVSPLSRAMADGIDHFLGVSGTTVGTRRNGAQCPQFPGPQFPNRVDSGGGNSPSDLTNGLVLGGDYDGSFEGRLAKKTWGGPYGGAKVFTKPIDNRPLWSYIDTNILIPGLHVDCSLAAAGPAQHGDYSDPVAEAAFVSAQQALEDCLSGASIPPPSSLFKDDLYESHRLTTVPEYWELSPLNSNACCYNIKTFQPVFIDGIWSATGPKWTCTGGIVSNTSDGFCKHEPGRVGEIHIKAQGKRKLSSANAIVLSCDLLPGVESPDEKCKRIGIGGSQAEVFLNLYLTR